MKRLDFFVWQNILINVANGQCMGDLVSSVGAQYSHIHEVATYLSDRKLITLTKAGRLKVIELTPIGREVKNALLKVRELTTETQETPAA